MQDYQTYLQDRWAKGNVWIEKVGVVNPTKKQRTQSYKKCMNYVVKYVVKGSDDKFTEIQMWSQGLGSAFLRGIGNQVMSDPYIKNLVYFDYSSGQYKPIVIDKVFCYYAFNKKYYKKYLDSRRFIERFGNEQISNKIKSYIDDNQLQIQFAPVVQQKPILYTGCDYQDKVDKAINNILYWSEIQRRQSVFLSQNLPTIDKKTFKEIRDLRLKQIKEQLERRHDREKI